ncbi:ParB-like dsDNA partitioning protein [Achromobacter phage Mano]|uniref:ParB-like dsDNA partitioning protein n=1 Tax=Achromobacter phage Mano TaxID=2767570 RepID=A0A7L8G6C1_9CAUD|nr:ParB-like partition protein [Achromobacter phage Mano]QOE32774.1 ParB-like dsDNA partitioning protein [Achromobacter phage Mano]
MATSFKQLIKDGTISRGDLLRAQHADIQVEPGFNICLDPEEFERQAQALADFILAGNPIPPLLLRVASDGTLFIVDGHLRHRALAIAIERAEDAKVREKLSVVSFLPFTGNDVDRLAMVFTTREGRQLTELERAMGYKRFSALGLSSAEIAVRVNRSRTHVDQLLLLANANADVHQMVKAGTVGAAVAVDMVRKHGEDAGKVLAGALNKAKAQGKGKVTAGTIRGKGISRDQVNGLWDSVDAVLDEIGTDARVALESANDNDAPVALTLPAWALRDLIAVHAGIKEAKEAEAQRVRDAQAKAAQQELAGAA